MKKQILTLGLILLVMLPLVTAQDEITEPEIEEEYKENIPTNRFQYFFKIQLMESLRSFPKYFNREERINYKLEQLERRRIEIESYLEKLNKTTSNQWRNRYQNMIKFINKREESNIKRLEKYSELVNSEKKTKIKTILENRDLKLNQLRERFQEMNQEDLEGINNAISQSEQIREKLNNKIMETQADSSNGAKRIQIGGI